MIKSFSEGLTCGRKIQNRAKISPLKAGKKLGILFDAMLKMLLSPSLMVGGSLGVEKKYVGGVCSAFITNLLHSL